MQGVAGDKPVLGHKKALWCDAVVEHPIDS